MSTEGTRVVPLRWLGQPFVLGDATAAAVPEITAHLVESGMLAEDQGVLGIGGEGEAAFGRQHFLDLVSVFTSPPVFSVRHGRTEIGLVPDEALQLRDPDKAAGGASVLLLGGRPWQITQVDWSRRMVHVVPSDRPGTARWFGTAQPLGAVVCRSIREVLAGDDPPHVTLSKRAIAQLDELRDAHSWARSGATTLVRDEKGGSSGGGPSRGCSPTPGSAPAPVAAHRGGRTRQPHRNARLVDHR